MPARPTVAIITAVRNGEATLARTLESVERQTWRPLEHVVVDGASTDSTCAILQRHGSRLNWVSEPDRGLYDAMNKGLGLVRDREAYVLFLNADDMFHGDDAIERAMAAAAGEDLIYGRLERFDEDLDYRDIIGREVTARDMVLGMRCHHQAMFTRGRVFDRVGGFDLRYRIAADYDWAVRVMLNGSVSKRFVPVVIATMSRGGLSDRHYLRSVRERWQIVRRHYPLVELLRYTVWTGVGDYARYYAQRALKRMGLLNRVRDAKRRLRPPVLPPQAPVA
jgi:glycosyltransferase involved in cell wall biosynthesis